MLLDRSAAAVTGLAALVSGLAQPVATRSPELAGEDGYEPFTTGGDGRVKGGGHGGKGIGNGSQGSDGSPGGVGKGESVDRSTEGDTGRADSRKPVVVEQRASPADGETGGLLNGAAATAIGAAALLVVGCLWGRARSGYSALRRDQPVRVRYELAGGQREDGELSLGGIQTVMELRRQLLVLAADLLLDVEEDLGEWTLRYTDSVGVLLPVTSRMRMAVLRMEAQELRVTAGQALPTSSKPSASIPLSCSPARHAFTQ